MSYLVTVTFDLKNPATSDYETAREVLTNLGFRKSIVGSTGKPRDLPTTTYAGEFNGESTVKVRADLAEAIRSKFAERGVSASIFISVGGDWAWAIRYT